MLISALCEKEVVDARDGTRIGFVDDLLFNERTAVIEKIVVCERPKIAAIFAKRPEVEILWSDIAVIGSDIILVNMTK